MIINKTIKVNKIIACRDGVNILPGKEYQAYINPVKNFILVDAAQGLKVIVAKESLVED